jgi:hypothetical protein
MSSLSRRSQANVERTVTAKGRRLMPAALAAPAIMLKVRSLVDVYIDPTLPYPSLP